MRKIMPNKKKKKKQKFIPIKQFEDREAKQEKEAKQPIENAACQETLGRDLRREDEEERSDRGDEFLLGAARDTSGDRTNASEQTTYISKDVCRSKRECPVQQSPRNHNAESTVIDNVRTIVDSNKCREKLLPRRKEVRKDSDENEEHRKEETILDSKSQTTASAADEKGAITGEAIDVNISPCLSMNDSKDGQLSDTKSDSALEGAQNPESTSEDTLARQVRTPQSGSLESNRKENEDTKGKGDTVALSYNCKMEQTVINENKVHNVTNVNVYVQGVQNINNLQIGGNNQMNVVESNGAHKEPRVKEQFEIKEAAVKGSVSGDVPVLPALCENCMDDTSRDLANKRQPTPDSVSSSTGAIGVEQESLTPEASSLTAQSNMSQFFNLVDNFQKGNFVLIVGKMQPVPILQQLALVPWTLVFDFDQQSRDTGLLSLVEKRIESIRRLHIKTWKDSCHFNDNSTTWCFLRGFSDFPDSLIDKTNDCSQWLRVVKDNLNDCLADLGSFANCVTCVRVVVFWPEQTDVGPHMYRVLLAMEDYLRPYPRIIVCQNDKQPNRRLLTLKEDHKEETHIVEINTEYLCETLETQIGKSNLTKDIVYQLPVAEEVSKELKIKPSKMIALGELFSVLYLDNPYQKKSEEQQQADTEEFFKGGHLPWYMYYEKATKQQDADRDIFRTTVAKVRHLLNDVTPGVITIYHAPGAGGTTLAKRVLFTLRNFRPCVQLAVPLDTKLPDITGAVQFLYEYSHHPLLMLIDGEDEQKVKELATKLEWAYVVILNVQRCPIPKKMDELKPNQPYVYLPGKVSAEEAKKLCRKFSDHCKRADKTRVLKSFVDDVQKGVPHSVYEFGLVAYHKQFRGLKRYVNGYLEVRHGEKLSNVHKILGFLSLSYYYGQCGMPCIFFSSLLGRGPSHMITIDDFPTQAREFIVVDTDSSRQKTFIRISHQLIAEEILEQILTHNCQVQEEREFGRLSTTARNHLKDFAAQFIDETKLIERQEEITSVALLNILVRTFIHRSAMPRDRDTDEQQTGQKSPVSRLLADGQKAPVSRLLTDVLSDPPYTEKLFVLEKLKTAYPKEPSFLAHLARCYSLYREDMEEQTKELFNLAIKNAKSRLKEDMGITLRHIYHMYGTMYKKQIHRNISIVRSDPERAPGVLQNILSQANKACSLYVKSRKATPSGTEEMYGYSDEITMRLMVCDCIVSHYKQRGVRHTADLAWIYHENKRACKFITNSIYEIDKLLVECDLVFESEEVGESSMSSMVAWYQHFFQAQAPGFENLLDVDTIAHGQMEFLGRKLKYKSYRYSKGALDAIDSEEDIVAMIRRHEQVFSDAEHGKIDDKKEFNISCSEWLSLVRHRKCMKVYTLEQALIRVRTWEKQMRTPLSQMYLFILTSIMGFGTEGGRANNILLVEAKQHLEQVKKAMRQLVRKPRHPIEWLGKGPGIKCLIPGYKIKIESAEFREVKPHEELRPMTGTIKGPNNNKYLGFISMHLDGNIGQVDVSFLPIKSNPRLVGSLHADTRVRFYLAFTSLFGCEAYNVKAIED